MSIKNIYVLLVFLFIGSMVFSGCKGHSAEDIASGGGGGAAAAAAAKASSNASGGSSNSGGSSSNVYTSDSFNRANAATLGNTDIASGGTSVAWQLAGSWGISSNGAIPTALQPPDNDLAAAVVDTGNANCTVQVKIATQSASALAAVIFRTADDAWMLYSDPANTFNSVDGAGYVLSDTSKEDFDPGRHIAVTPADGDVLRVELDGSNVVVKINGVVRDSVANNGSTKTNTMYGLLSWGGLGPVFDDFLIENCH